MAVDWNTALLYGAVIGAGSFLVSRDIKKAGLFALFFVLGFALIQSLRARETI